MTKTMTRIDGTVVTLTQIYRPQDDRNDHTACNACGREFAYGIAATDQDGNVVHWSFDCTNPRSW